MNEKNNIQKSTRKKNIKAGSYTVVMSAILLAALIVVNLLINALPSKFTNLDSSSSKMYTLSETTKKYLSGLSEDITLWFVCPGGQEDAQLAQFLKRYSELSPHLSLRVADPIADPDFITKYTESQVSSYSVIIESARRSKIIDYNDMYYYYNSQYGKLSAAEYQMYAQYGLTAEPYFDGDNQLTSAIEYTTAEKLPTLYTLTGHGEQELSQTLSYYLGIAISEPKSLNIALEGDDIPADCSCIFIYAPSLDLTESELKKLTDYVNGGGHIFFVSASTTSIPDNFAALAAAYGLEGSFGTVNEGSAADYYPGTPYYFYPNVSSTHTAVSMISQNSYRVLSGQSHAITAKAALPDGFTVTELLTTSSKGYLKTSDNTQTDPGALSIASASENSTTGARMVWLASYQLTSDTFINSTNGANLYCVLNMLTWLCDSFTSSLPEISAVDISSGTLTVSESSAGIWGFIFIFFIPIAVAAAGLARWTQRRRK